VTTIWRLRAEDGEAKPLPNRPEGGNNSFIEINLAICDKKQEKPTQRKIRKSCLLPINLSIRIEMLIR
ncbi:MAG: hypothetical protein Q3994_04650, partial [Prevotella sp.]|nr:hypothetical protein [Prevotella sp.]